MDRFFNVIQMEACVYRGTVVICDVLNVWLYLGGTAPDSFGVEHALPPKLPGVYTRCQLVPK